MEGSSGRWDIDGVLEEVEMQAQDAVVSIHTSQAELATRPASHGRLVTALKAIAKYKNAKGRRAAEDSDTPEDDRVATSAMLVESLWALATNCLTRRVDEKHMQVEAGREMSREARRRQELYERYAEQVSNRVWTRTRLANLANDPVTCPISGDQAYDTDHATAIQMSVIPNQGAPFDPHIAGQQADTWRADTDLTNRPQCVPLTPSENNPDVHL